MKNNLIRKVSLVFDDGFPTSSRRVASIFEEYKLQAVFAVLSRPELFNERCSQEAGGGWPLYKELRDRGHIIHPHGSDHKNLTTLEFSDATASIQNCFEDFQKNNYSLASSTFHYPYNSGSASLNRYLLHYVRWIRVGATNNLVWNRQQEIDEGVLFCTGYGPDFCDEHLLNLLESSIPDDGRLLIYNLHGIEGEGWGSIHEKALRVALERIITSPILSYSTLEDLE